MALRYGIVGTCLAVLTILGTCLRLDEEQLQLAASLYLRNSDENRRVRGVTPRPIGHEFSTSPERAR